MMTVRSIARRLLPLRVKQAIRRRRPIVWSRGETNISLAIRDLVRLGDTVFDVGANAGDYSLTMSKLVGTSGSVHAFEANPRLVERMRARLESAGTVNCTVVDAAVADREGPMDFFLDPRDGAPASTVMTSLATESRLGQSIERITVSSITLDSFCERQRLVPSFVKIDIEGAEELAFRGFQRTLSVSTPHLLFEFGGTNGPANRCLEFLSDHGYQLVDLSDLEWTNSGRYAGRAFLTDILAIHSIRLGKTPYAGLRSTGMSAAGGRARLAPGRYRALFQLGPGETEVELAVMVGSRYLRAIRAWTGAAEFDPSLVFDVAEPSQIDFRYRDVTRKSVWRPATVELTGFKIERSVS